MRLRTAAVVVITSACVAGVAPAYAYWSQPIDVELPLRLGQVSPPGALRAERTGPGSATVTLHWHKPTNTSVEVTGYLVERADQTGAGSAWSVLDGAATCTDDGMCQLTDEVAPTQAAYRVRAEAGTWRSDPSAVARSTVVPDVTEPTPSPTVPAPDTSTASPSDPTDPIDQAPQPDSTSAPTTDPTAAPTDL